MSVQEHEFLIEPQTDDQLKQYRLGLQTELAVSAQILSDANILWHGVLERVLASNVELAARGIDPASFLYERPMPESLAGPDGPMLRIVT